MHGNSIEEKTVNIIDWFIQEEVKEKPKSNLSSASKSKRKRGNQKTFSIESTQEDDSNLPSVGCRIRMCVEYDDKGKMSAVIITPKEDVDYQFWYPKRNRVINEYKHIKDNYSWSDEVVKESEYAKGATSPKIYDLRTPQKKSETKKTHSSELSDNWYSSDSSDMVVEPIKDYKSTGQTKPMRLSKTTMVSKPTNTKSSNMWESSQRDKSQLSIVDRILMEESSCDKHSKTGSVNKAKKTAINLLRMFIHMDKWYIIYFQAEKSSTSHTMSKLFENELQIAKEEDEDEDLFLMEDDDKAGTWKSKKRSMLPKGNPAAYF